MLRGRVAQTRRLNGVRPQGEAYAPNVRPDRRGRRLRQVATPKRIDDAFRADRPAPRQRDDTQKCPLLRPVQRDALITDAHHQRAEHPDLHEPTVPARVTAVSHRCRAARR